MMRKIKSDLTNTLTTEHPVEEEKQNLRGKKRVGGFYLKSV